MTLILSDDVELEELRREYLHYINVVLPSISSNNKQYPVYLNHCWARIILDNICDDKWSNVLDRPAYKALNKYMLKRAINTAKNMVNSIDLAIYLNKRSLGFRSKSNRKN